MILFEKRGLKMKTYCLSTLNRTTIQNKQKELYISMFCKVLVVFFCLSFSSLSYSHRGAADEVDNCRIKVGFEKIHFTAYTPEFTKSKGFCQFIPNIGMTNLVFDYEGKKLRNVSIEFEVTKEPEGVRVFYQQPQKIKTGTVNAPVDFSKFGAGDYLAHVTIVHNGEKLDTHLPFSIGVGDTKIPWGKIVFFLLVVLFIAFFVKTNRNNQINNRHSDSEQTKK